MSIYLDTSALMKLYYSEPESERMSEWVLKTRLSLLYSSFHELELKNALLLKVFRHEMSLKQYRKISLDLDSDLQSGVLLRPVIAWPTVLAKAIVISEKYTKNSGGRSLDIVHVAIASSLNCTHFFSYDQRQNKIAKKTGLKIIGIW